MPFKAGFAEVDITPPVGTLKIGWKKIIVSDQILDPLYARVVVFETDNDRLAFIQLDTLSIRWTQVNDIRGRITDHYGPWSVMVSATHNHAGPAVANAGEVPRDETYVETLVTRIVECFGRAVEAMQDAEIARGHGTEWGVAHNRRVVMRGGTVKTHGTFDDPDALCLEGPIDPEITVLGVRDMKNNLLGTLVNFTCHPTHYGGETILSAGYPGALAAEMKERGSPVTLFLNGAAGNIHHSNPCRGGQSMTHEEMGSRLAGAVSRIMENLDYSNDVTMGSASRTIRLPFRTITDSELKGTVRGAQRFINSAIYDREMPRLHERIHRLETQPAEVQAFFINGMACVAIPAEYFVELGLRIKEETHPRRTIIAGYANGMVGYVPHADAFRRGGYETTLCNSSRLAPETGDLLAACAIDLINAGPVGT